MYGFNTKTRYQVKLFLFVAALALFYNSPGWSTLISGFATSWMFLQRAKMESINNLWWIILSTSVCLVSIFLTLSIQVKDVLGKELLSTEQCRLVEQSLALLLAGCIISSSIVPYNTNDYVSSSSNFISSQRKRIRDKREQARSKSLVVQDMMRNIRKSSSFDSTISNTSFDNHNDQDSMAYSDEATNGTRDGQYGQDDADEEDEEEEKVDLWLTGETVNQGAESDNEQDDVDTTQSPKFSFILVWIVMVFGLHVLWIDLEKSGGILILVLFHVVGFSGMKRLMIQGVDIYVLH